MVCRLRSAATLFTGTQALLRRIAQRRRTTVGLKRYEIEPVRMASFARFSSSESVDAPSRLGPAPWDLILHGGSSWIVWWRSWTETAG